MPRPAMEPTPQSPSTPWLFNECLHTGANAFTRAHKYTHAHPPPHPTLQVSKLQCLEELDLYLTPATPHQPVELLPAALRALSRLRTLYVIAPQSLSECLVIGPGLAELPALQAGGGRAGPGSGRAAWGMQAGGEGS